jgi:hypothetical protein
VNCYLLFYKYHLCKLYYFIGNCQVISLNYEIFLLSALRQLERFLPIGPQWSSFLHLNVSISTALSPQLLSYWQTLVFISYKDNKFCHVCDCLLQQSYTLYIYYNLSCLWLFVTTVVHCIHILQAVMSVIVCYNSRTLYIYTTSRHVCDCLLQQSYTVYIYYKRHDRL